jgi:uncharacterized membrane protein YqiK
MNSMVMFAAFAVCGTVGLFLLLKLIGLRVIPNNKVAIVEKWWSMRGSLDQRIIALKGESGFQPEVLRGGIHFRSPLMYKVHRVPLVTIPQGQIGYVFSREGDSLEPAQTLGRVIAEGRQFQDARGFILHGGQKGQQREILREGTYALNLAQFIVFTSNQVYYLPIDDNREEKSLVANMQQTLVERHAFYPLVLKGVEDDLGVVTTHDGPALDNGHIIAPVVGDDANAEETYHNSFQDVEKFLKAGGRRGRQHQVLVEGTYYINRLFATVELIHKTVIEVGNVGVVVSYTGEKGKDMTGSEYKHGELVEKGFRGIWQEPLNPGKYAFNTYAGKIIAVPTTNIILKWISTQSGTHRYDENLKEVSLITKDAFEPLLPLSIVIHIDYKKAPLVIQRFGEIRKLVEQSLDPMISSYFKNIGQTYTLIELIHNRSEIQERANAEMRLKFAHYNLDLEEVLIGTPSGSGADSRIETILTQLRERQIAEERMKTFQVQQKAAEKERELKESEAKAEQQKNLTSSSIDIEVQENKGKAEYRRALQEAEKIKAMAHADSERMKTLAQGESERMKALAEGEAEKIRLVAEAEAEKEAQVGIGRAIAMQEQVNAMGGPRYQVMQEVLAKFADAIKQGGVEIVPRSMIVMGGNGEQSAQPNVFETLITLLMSEKLGAEWTGQKEPSPMVKKLKERIEGGEM